MDGRQNRLIVMIVKEESLPSFRIMSWLANTEGGRMVRGTKGDESDGKCLHGIHYAAPMCQGPEMKRP